MSAAEPPDRRDPRRDQIGDVIFELVRIGAYMKATAIDVRTGVEATVVGPVVGTGEQLKRLALRKLQRRLGG